MKKRTSRCIMKLVSKISSLLSLIALVFCGQNCLGQCFVNVTKNCGNEQFTNECSEPCNVVGGECGLWVEGNSNLNYASVRSANEAELGGSAISFIPIPRFCGVARKCRCATGVLGELFCQRNGDRHADYFVTESQVDFEENCTGGGGPGGPLP
jgi:hypothetical protein